MEYTVATLSTKTVNTIYLCTCIKALPPSYHDRMTFSTLHTLNNRATPEQMCNYKQALLLHKVINHETPKVDWIDTHFQQTFDNWVSTFTLFKTNNYKVELNNICNRLAVVNGKIKYGSLKKSFEYYDQKCKHFVLQ